MQRFLRILGIRGQNGRAWNMTSVMAETCMESLKEYYHTDFPEGEKQFTVLVLGAAEIQEFTDEASRQTYMEANQNICRVTDKVISITGNILGQGLDRDDYLFDSLLLYMKSKTLKLQVRHPGGKSSEGGSEVQVSQYLCRCLVGKSCH